MKLAVMLAAAFSLAYCNTPPAPSPPAPSDATPSCATACDRLRVLGCPEAAPTDEGASCEMVCENAAASPAPLNVACMTRAASCPAFEACP